MAESFKQLLDGGFVFNKALGQNFISDTNLLKAIAADSLITKDDVIVEVGTGAATLTRELCLAAKRVVSIETDTRLKPIIDNALAGLDNIEVVFNDILKLDKSRIIEMTGGEFKVVANLPYYITAPVIFYFLEFAQLKSLTVMVQKEVAERIVAHAGTPEYGAFSAQVRLLGEPVITRKVGRNMFTPPPNVDSAVVRIDISPKLDAKQAEFTKRIIASAFKMRRKTLANNLAADFAISKSDAAAIIKSAGFDESIRGERLDINDFIKLSRLMQKGF